jgi:predicted Zn-dependent protease
MRISVRATSLIGLLVLLAPRVTLAQSSGEAWAAFQKAKLATRADSAEDAYLTVALSHPTSPYAAESLLRLGQARLANNDPKQAIVYLQRLLADYPRSEHRALGALWLGRAQLATNNARAACTTINSGLKLQQIDTETTALLRTEQTTACAATSAGKANAAAAAPASTAGRFAIQVGAFRERAGARAYARGLEQAGFERARVSVMPENALYRVRVGQYESAAAAQKTVAKLKAAGYSAVVVADRQRERLIKD